jgi:hypothetical protein
VLIVQPLLNAKLIAIVNTVAVKKNGEAGKGFAFFVINLYVNKRAIVMAIASNPITPRKAPSAAHIFTSPLAQANPTGDL